ncbi:S-adenosylmethionine:tRNA ribosyltransferase-isomerase [Streptomyces sp. NPDC002055]|uniref:S-adenosylmethionine:tRNA ribosyltransferase-isomerase n=1 Tax=Streptomyces sp. NPDC002055 TaxID=3154534 RepID=UPI00332DFE21
MTVFEALRVPEELLARVPAEQRGPGLGRDSVRLLAGRGAELSHRWFRDLPELLGAGDVLVVNTSRTLPAAVDGRLGDGRGEPVVVHFSTHGGPDRPGSGPDGECWSVELRSPDGRGSTLPRAVGPRGALVRLPGGALLRVEEPLNGPGSRLWWATLLPPGAGGGQPAPGDAGVPVPGPGAGSGVRGGSGVQAGAGPGSGSGGPAGFGTGTGAGPGAEGAGSGGGASGPVTGVPALLHRYGRPIRYRYTERDQPLAAHQTVFAAPSPDGDGSAEMPSAARPFTAAMVAELVSRGVQFAPVTLHTGVASTESHEPP